MAAPSANALCPMPYALCPMPYALCPMPYALCPMPYALCPILASVPWAGSNFPLLRDLARLTPLRKCVVRLPSGPNLGPAGLGCAQCLSRRPLAVRSPLNRGACARRTRGMEAGVRALVGCEIGEDVDRAIRNDYEHVDRFIALPGAFGFVEGQTLRRVDAVEPADDLVRWVLGSFAIRLG